MIRSKPLNSINMFMLCRSREHLIQAEDRAKCNNRANKLQMNLKKKLHRDKKIKKECKKVVCLCNNLTNVFSDRSMLSQISVDVNVCKKFQEQKHR